MTVKKEPRTLETICEDVNFSMTILGNTYCKIKPSQPILCDYRSQFKDHNKIYICLHPKYNLSDYYEI